MNWANCKIEGCTYWQLYLQEMAVGGASVGTHFRIRCFQQNTELRGAFLCLVFLKAAVVELHQLDCLLLVRAEVSVCLADSKTRMLN